MLICDLMNFMRQNEYETKGFDSIFEPLDFFQNKYSNSIKWNDEQFSKELEQYIEKQVRPDTKKFCTMYYRSYSVAEYSCVPKRAEFMELIVSEVKETIKNNYQNKQNQETTQQTSKSNQTIEVEFSKPLRNQEQDGAEPITLDDFISSLAEYQGEYGESKLANKIIELLKEHPQNQKEMNQLRKQMRKAIQQLLSFDNNARKYCLNRYHSSVKTIATYIYVDWLKKVLERGETDIEKQEEQKQEIEINDYNMTPSLDYA